MEIKKVNPFLNVIREVLQGNIYKVQKYITYGDKVDKGQTMHSLPFLQLHPHLTKNPQPEFYYCVTHHYSYTPSHVMRKYKTQVFFITFMLFIKPVKLHGHNTIQHELRVEELEPLPDSSRLWSCLWVVEK